MPKRSTYVPLRLTRRGKIALGITYALALILGILLTATGVLDVSCAFGTGLENGVCSQ
jgi:hypothetical protein